MLGLGLHLDRFVFNEVCRYLLDFVADDATDFGLVILAQGSKGIRIGNDHGVPVVHWKAVVVGQKFVPVFGAASARSQHTRSEEHTSELQSLMRISYAVFCLKKKKTYDKHIPCKHNKNKQA